MNTNDPPSPARVALMIVAVLLAIVAALLLAGVFVSYGAVVPAEIEQAEELAAKIAAVGDAI